LGRFRGLLVPGVAPRHLRVALVGGGPQRAAAGGAPAARRTGGIGFYGL